MYIMFYTPWYIKRYIIFIIIGNVPSVHQKLSLEVY